MKTWTPVVIVAVWGAWLPMPVRGAEPTERGWHSAGAIASVAESPAAIRFADDSLPDATGDPLSKGWHKLGMRQPAAGFSTPAPEVAPRFSDRQTAAPGSGLSHAKQTRRVRSFGRPKRAGKNAW